ncbi:hypothetical protein LTR97_007101 [Elasticomyces elasticus]|uniref:RNA helicase HEL117 n=1 Tax=Elasticomyces elasticus TaxID=574655 RepID=A0AAN7W5V7_9PEZI|nr:hypothetical protein LTR97_007101 [Elasticomyces elasticus]
MSSSARQLNVYSRKRSRSPHEHDKSKDVKRHRSRSPHRKGHHHHSKSSEKSVRLPFHAHHLHKRDLNAYTPVFAEYLDIQKGKDIAELSEDEVKGRWKSFLGKWNRGELAEGWYDPEMKAKADERYVPPFNTSNVVNEPNAAPNAGTNGERDDRSDEDEDDGYGPALPDAARRKAGPSVPGFQDIQQRREQAVEDREAHRTDMRYERKQERDLAKERLDELAPRADAGSRERQLEKKREVTASNRAFRDAKEGGDVEVGDRDLLGDDADSHKAELKNMEKKKSERELRKEEVMRAREAEREERVADYRRKEDKTMNMLKEIAKQRFG